jgi:hypothetical protein
MTGRFKGFVSRLKQNISRVGSTHCFIYREALMAKNIPTELESVFDSDVKTVNFVRSRAIKTRLLRQMCHEAGSRHDTLVLHTDIRWLSKGKFLERFFELKNELLNMFSIETPDFAAQLNDEEWCAKVAYLADIFSHLNYLKKSIQGKKENG